MSINYKWKYEELSKLNSKLKEAIVESYSYQKKILDGWRHSLDVWENQIKGEFIQAILIYIFGMLIGIGITWSILR